MTMELDQNGNGTCNFVIKNKINKWTWQRNLCQWGYQLMLPVAHR